MQVDQFLPFPFGRGQIWQKALPERHFGPNMADCPLHFRKFLRSDGVKS